jgi:hypothetical protein
LLVVKQPATETSLSISLFDKQHPAHHNLNNQQLKPLEAYVSFCLAFQHIIT